MRPILLAALASGCFGAIPTPNCFFGFNLTAGSTPAYANNPSGQGQCKYWTVTYRANGFSAVSVVLQAANDSNGAPGSWGTFQSIAQAGTLVSGANPNSSTTAGLAGASGYAPWVRVTLTSSTGAGAVNGSAAGWLQNPFGTSSSSGSTISCSGSGCVVIGPTATGGTPIEAPVYLGIQDGSGNVMSYPDCDGVRPFDLTGGTTAVFGNAMVCSWSGTAESSVDVQLVQGSGRNCGGSQPISGIYQQVLSFAFDWGSTGALRATPLSQICISIGAAVRVTGTVVYRTYP